jgi:molybdopterin-containing oxidoreductase family membrane subunit
VLRGRPFAFREGLAIWPSTFFLFVLSAAAVGPSFLLLTTTLVEKLTGRRLVREEVYRTLAKTSGVLLGAYVLLKCVDTLIWLNATSQRAGFAPSQYYSWPGFGTWILFLEIVVFGLVPAYMLVRPALRGQAGWRVTAALLACAGIALNRYVLTIQTLALPTLPFDEVLTYAPSWQETGAFAAVIAYGVVVYSFSFRYLTLFPQERELLVEGKE